MHFLRSNKGMEPTKEFRTPHHGAFIAEAHPHVMIPECRCLAYASTESTGQTITDGGLLRSSFTDRGGRALFSGAATDRSSCPQAAPTAVRGSIIDC